MTHYRAYCCECDYTTDEGRQSRTFLDPFFLPERCEKCGDFKSQHTRFYEKQGWIVEYGYWERDIEFKLLKPSTWFSNYTWRVKE